MTEKFCDSVPMNLFSVSGFSNLIKSRCHKTLRFTFEFETCMNCVNCNMKQRSFSAFCNAVQV